MIAKYFTYIRPFRFYFIREFLQLLISINLKPNQEFVVL